MAKFVRTLLGWSALSMAWCASGPLGVAAQEPLVSDTEADAGQGPAAEASTPPAWRNPSAPAWPKGAPPRAATDVVLTVAVDAEGAPIEVRAAPGDNPDVAPAFLRAAEAFLRAQTFEPARRDGQPVSSRIQVRLHFEPPAPGAADGADPEAAQPPPAPASDVTTSNAVSTDEPPAPVPEYAARAALRNGSARRRPVAASDLDIEVGALGDVPRRDAMQLLTLAPGIVLTNHAGEGHAYAAFLRGFDAGEGQDLEVRVQGIPLNEPSNAHLHGYADTHFVIPELVRSLRVLEGPFDARQADFAAAGSAQFRLAAAEPGIRLQGGLGSFGRHRLLAVYSPADASRETFGAVDLVQGDGFGPGRSHESVRALGQYHGRARLFDYRLLFASHALRFDSVGVVRQDAVESGEVRCGSSEVAPFFCFHDPNQGGQASRHLASVELRERRPGRQWGQQLTLMFRDTRFRENFTGALLDPRGDAVEQRTRTVTLVGGGHYRFDTTWGERPQTFELGYEGRHDRGDASIWRVRRDDQIPYDTVLDNDLALTRVSLYALGELSFWRWLSWELGARIDTFGYDVIDRDQPTSDREGERLAVQAVGAWGTNVQPRTTLTLGPALGTSWVSSFGIGSRSSDAAALSEGERAPFTRIWAAESGLVSEGQSRRNVAVSARSAFFYAHVDRDLLFDETRGRNVPTGATNRYGAYVHGRLQWGGRLDCVASFTWAEAYRSQDGTPAGFVTGPRLPFVPRFVARGDVAFTERVSLPKAPVFVRGALGVGWVGPRPLPLNTFSRSIFSLDAALRVRVHMFELSLQGENLADRRNRSAEYFHASDFATGGPTMRRVRHFSAAPPRRFMVNLAVLFEPSEREER